MPGWAGYVVRRVAAAVVLLLLLLLVTFFAFWKIPSEPAAFLIDVRNATPAQIAQARHTLGADGSVFEQFGRYLGRALHGDLGRTWNGQRGGFSVPEAGGTPVVGEVLRAAGITGSLVLGGMLLLLLLSIPIGLWSAARPRSGFDRGAAGFGVLGIATHPLVVALLLQLFIASKWHLVAQTGYCNLLPEAVTNSSYDPQVACSGPLGWAEHLLLPWVAFTFFFVALYSRMVRTKALEVLSEPYIRTAEAKGASEWRVLTRHVLPNMRLTLATMLAMDIGTAVAIAAYIESVFRLPGLGLVTIRSMGGAGLDLPMLLGIVVVTGAIIILLNLIVDLSAVALDPTITRTPRSRSRILALAGRAG